MRKLIAGIVGIMVLAGPAAGEDGYSSFYTGNELLAACKKGERNPNWDATCIGYVVGALDVLMRTNWLLTGTACPKNGMDGRQVRNIVVKYLTGHPERRDGDASRLLEFAFDEAWQCGFRETAIFLFELRKPEQASQR
jgi:hypothetical protein